MTRKQVNQLQRRTLKPDGYKYDSLIEETNCRVFETGHGPAGEILTAMVRYATKYAYQVKKVAQKLRKNDLQSTCNAFYQFQRDYIQYDVDGREQRLRTPSCLWSDRKKGGDCKSFAIMSAALCASIGIKSILRQIKVDGTQHENRINHVYCIVPVDQVTGSLKSGYYVIDGSAKVNIEAPYYWKNDMEVDLPYYGMNGVNTTQQETTCGCDNAYSNKEQHDKGLLLYYFNKFKQVLDASVKRGASESSMKAAANSCLNSIQKGIEPSLGMNSYGVTVNDVTYPFSGIQGMNLDPMTIAALLNGAANSGSDSSGDPDASSGSGAFGGILSQLTSGGNLFGPLTAVLPGISDVLATGDLSCTRSWYDSSDYQSDVNYVDSFITERKNSLEAALSNGNVVLAQDILTDMIGNITIIAKSYQAKRDEGWRSGCTETNLQSMADYASTVARDISTQLMPELRKTFNITVLGKEEFTSDDVKTQLYALHLRPMQTHSQDIYSLQIKPELLAQYQQSQLPANTSNGSTNGSGDDTPRENGLSTNATITLGFLAAAALGTILLKPKKGPTTSKK